MKTPRLLPFLAATLIGAGALAMEPMPPGEKVPVEGTDRWRVRYADGQLSLNDLCPVAKRGLATRMRPVWVNGRPVGFC